MGKYQCPYCRGEFFDDWRDFQEYQKLVYHWGLVTISAVYFIKYLHDNFIFYILFRLFLALIHVAEFPVAEFETNRTIATPAL